MTGTAAPHTRRLGWLAALLILVTACGRSPEPGADQPRPATTATAAAPAGLRVQEYPVPAGSRPHDVAPGRRRRRLVHRPGVRRARPARPGHRRDPPYPARRWLGAARRDRRAGRRALDHRRRPERDRARRPAHRAGRPLPACRPAGPANLNTAVFDRRGVLWFTGQTGVYGRLDPTIGAVEVFDAPRGRGPLRHHRHPGRARSTTPRWPAATSRASTPRPAQATVIDPPTAGQGARRVWSTRRAASG